jgi:LysM repeat protein
VRRFLVLPIAGLALAASSSESSRADTYRVRPGDTLTAIAARFGTTVPALARANRLNPAHVLLAGTVLSVGGTTAEPVGFYRVRRGDTLSGIAARYGTSVRALARANRLDANGVLFAGITIKVPGGAAASAPVVADASPAATADYRVVYGDTLSAIAARFGTTVNALAAANHLDPSRVLLANSLLAVPGSGGQGRGGPGAPTVTPDRQPLSHSAVRSMIVYWSSRYGVDTQLALALAWMESGYQATLVSPAGAGGPMQVTPDTRAFVEAVLLGMPIPQTTNGDVQAGVVYLRYLLQRFGGDERLALAGYFQGPEHVRRHLLPATRVYVANVLALKSRV